MLAQGQSSSAKRGELAAVSSGLVFLKKKKKPDLKAELMTRDNMDYYNAIESSIYQEDMSSKCTSFNNNLKT